MGLKHTVLSEQHQTLGARMVDFGGWSMPVQYSGIRQEHMAVRNAVGLFDVGHMGVLELTGAEAANAINHLVPNHIFRLQAGQGLYTQLCNPAGGTIDDILVFSISGNQWFMVVNAGNRQKDKTWVEQNISAFDCQLQSRFDDLTILALQGPNAEQTLKEALALDLPLSSFPPFSIQNRTWKNHPLYISRSGYTGEDGFEIYLPQNAAIQVWTQLLDKGQKHGIQPVGLGARDTLRLEAGMPLYGHELSEDISPLEAGLGWSVKLKSGGDFIGKPALQAQREKGITQKRIGLILQDTRRAPREGYPILVNGQEAGSITSGTLSPTLDKPIGMGFVQTAFDLESAEIEVQIRQQKFKAEKIKLPFYRRNPSP